MELKNEKEERKCLQCDKVLEVIEKQKPKSFCDDACRNKYFRIQQNELVRTAKDIQSGEFLKIPKSEYEEMQAQLKMLMDKNGEETEKLMTDVLHYGVAISKHDEAGKIERIDPESEEGFDAIERLKKQSKIEEYEKEIAVLGNTPLANKRKKFLKKQIELLKH
jgi:hypothetical protein